MVVENWWLPYAEFIATSPRRIYPGDLIFDFSNRMTEGILWDPDVTARWNDLFRM